MYISTVDRGAVDFELVGVQSNRVDGSLDIDLDCHTALKAEGPTKLEIPQLNIVVDGLDPNSLSERAYSLQVSTHESGRISRSWERGAIV